MKKYIGIIAIVISGFGVYILDKTWGDKIAWDKLNDFKIGELLSRQVSVLSILIFILLSFLIYLLLKPLLRIDTFYSKKHRKLRKMNHSNDQKNGLLYRWRVGFEWTGKPFISDLEIYCTKHGNTPRRFVDNRCPIPDCINYNQEVHTKFIHNHWESYLVDQWEKIN